jgi:hypothetical protein
MGEGGAGEYIVNIRQAGKAAHPTFMISCALRHTDTYILHTSFNSLCIFFSFSIFHLIPIRLFTYIPTYAGVSCLRDINAGVRVLSATLYTIYAPLVCVH